MLGHVRFLGSQCFSAPQKSICFSPSPPPHLLLERAAARLPRPWRAAGRWIRPAAWSSCPFVALRAPFRLGVVSSVVAGAQDEGKGGGKRGRHHHRVLRQHPGRCLAPALRALPRAAGRSNRPLCKSPSCLTSCRECMLCLRIARRKERGRRGQVGPWCGSFSRPSRSRRQTSRC
jgi:hypothetical protein